MKLTSVCRAPTSMSTAQSVLSSSGITNSEAESGTLIYISASRFVLLSASDTAALNPFCMYTWDTTALTSLAACPRGGSAVTVSPILNSTGVECISSYPSGCSNVSESFIRSSIVSPFILPVRDFTPADPSCSTSFEKLAGTPTERSLMRTFASPSAIAMASTTALEKSCSSINRPFSKPGYSFTPAPRTVMLSLPCALHMRHITLELPISSMAVFCFIFPP